MGTKIPNPKQPLLAQLFSKASCFFGRLGLQAYETEVFTLWSADHDGPSWLDVQCWLSSLSPSVTLH